MTLSSDWRYKPEPVIFLGSIAVGVYAVVFQAFISERICSTEFPAFAGYRCVKSLNANDSIHLESKSSRFAMLNQISFSVPAVLASLYFAVWSDFNGRKFPIVLTLSGFVFQNFLAVSLATFQNWPLWLILVGNFFNGCTGYTMVFFACCFSMVSDTAKDKSNLTVEIGIASGLVFAAVLLGSLVAGEIARVSIHAFQLNFLLVTFTTSLAFFYAVFILKDTTIFMKKQPSQLEINETDQSTFVTQKKASWMNVFKFIPEFVGVITVEREKRRRTHLIVGGLCFLITFSTDVGMPGLQYLFMSAPPFFMTQTDYSYQLAIQTSCSAAGLIFLPILFNKVFKLQDDLWLVMLGVGVTLVRSFWFAFSNKYWMILVYSLSYFGSSVIFTGYRSFCCKLVHHNETARLFAILSSVELLGPMLASAVFNVIYSFTVGIFIGFTWIVAGCVLMVVFVVICWLHVDYTKQNLPIEQLIEDQDC